MKEITLTGASKISSPNPVTIVCTQSRMAALTLLPYRGGLIWSYNPNMINHAMAKTSVQRRKWYGKIKRLFLQYRATRLPMS